jgi:dTMP kinase
VARESWYGEPPTGVDPSELKGALLVLEGPDGSGISTHVALLGEWLEQRGYPVAKTELTRSRLISEELDQAKLGNVLSPRTLSLFYATDFYDQLENVIVPAMRAGSVVLADRYIFTLMARDLVRGASPDWLHSLYSMVPVPDTVFYFRVSADMLSERTLTSRQHLDYWESGMDLGLARDWYESFEKYQRLLHEQFEALQLRYAFTPVDAERGLEETQQWLREAIAGVLETAYVPFSEDGRRQLRRANTGPWNIEIG